MADVLLVEDDDTLRETLSYLLHREGHEVRAVADGVSALDEFGVRQPDVILLDLMLPGVDGAEIARRVRLTSEVPIIMLTAKNSEADIVLGLELGADDYVTKPFSTPELLARVRSVVRRGRARGVGSGTREGQYDDGAVLRASGIEMDVERHRVSVDGVEAKLPLREFELLELLLRNAGRVLTRSQLVDRLWGADYVGDTKTLDVHVRRLRSKIERDPARPERLVTVRGLGYRLADV
ncbi:MAG: response regulator transcription factor [Propionibacteriaceae bacterium]|jgi:two-component system response regulator RegX3|nr:response regulator transcription factor [Propionibacteriaceae bacterium]